MSKTDDRTPSLSPLQPADVDAKLDRIAGLCAQTVTQQDRLARLYAANAQLDARTKRELLDFHTEARAVLSQLREAAESIPRRQPRQLAHNGGDGESSPSRRRRSQDDSQITASLQLQIRGGEEEGEGSEKKSAVKKALLTVLKAAALAAGGALVQWLRHQ